MKRILLSLMSIAAVSGLVFGVSRAFFSDKETSTGNTFQAGAIDLKVDYKSTYNGATSTAWTLKDLTSAEKFFDIADVKPGDKGEGTISLHVYNNDAWGCVSIIPTLNDDVSSTEPELEVTGETANTDSIYDGELAQNMQFRIWADTCANGGTPGDNIYQANCDTLLTEGTGPLTPTTWALADSTHSNVFTGLANNPLVGLQDYYLGVAWGVPDAVGNIIQTDKYMADISFTAVQSRNNPTFVCPTPVPQSELHQLVLENETVVVGGPWTIKSDNISGLLTWTDGDTFAYTLNAQGLSANTDYSLIYYADGWPGNNPGAFIGKHITDSSGNITGASGNPELGMDMPKLPDGNFAIGAKIWLVLTSDYNNGALSTGPMTAWQPDKYLFEGNVYIHYDDTNN